MLRRKKRIPAMIGCLFFSVLFGAPAAASNTYNARFENVDQILLFPGDVLFGAQDLVIGETGEEAALGPEGEWCNNRETVYQVNVDSETGAITLLPFGHTVTIENGISLSEDLYNDTHYVDREMNSIAEDYFVMEEEGNDDKDLAAYPDWSIVKISAREASDGEVFDHWESSDEIILEEPYSPDTSFMMGEENVSLRAVYTRSDAVDEFPADDGSGEDGDDLYIEESGGNPEDDVLFDEGGWYEESSEWNEEDSGWNEEGGVWFEESEEQESLQIEAGWDSENDPVFEISGNDEGSDSIFDNLDPSAFSDSGTVELDDYLEQSGALPPDQTSSEESMSSQTNTVTVDGGSILVNGEDEQISSWDYPQAEYVTVSTPQREDAVFDHWESDDEDVYFLAGDGERVNWFMMPDHDVNVRAVWSDTVSYEEEVSGAEMPFDAWGTNDIEEKVQEAEEEEKETEKKGKSYRIRIISEHVYVYGDVRINEENEIRAKEGAIVNLQADTLEDADFDYWAITRKSDDSEVPAEDIYSATTSFTMPDGSVYVSAHYKERVIEKHEVSVKHGTGAGSYAPGDTVILVAQTALEGEKFSKWKVNSGNVTLSDALSAQTSFIMGEEDVSVSATYEYIYYNLKVTSGSGSGTYKKGDKVDLTAQWPADGKEFDTWLVNSANANVSEPERFSTTMAMPADHVSVQALYKDGPSVKDNVISGISEGSAVMRGAAISFRASGAGMENADPNPGDFRWKPSGYRIGSASGIWSDGKSSTSMAINAAGNYTLYVDFQKEVWNGTSWEGNKGTDTRSVSFTVTAPTAAQTGDDTPVLPFVIAGAASLLVIILLVVWRLRRK